MSELQTNPFGPHTAGIGALSDAADSVLAEPKAGPRPWGPWATLGWTLLCAIMLFAIQVAVLLILMAVRLARGAEVKFDELASNGDVVSIGTLGSTVTIVGSVALLIRWRRYPIRCGVRSTRSRIPNRRRSIGSRSK